MYSVSSSAQSSQGLTSFWKSINELPTSIAGEGNTSSEIAASSLQSTSESIDWMIKNRGGMAFITGLFMCPSQILGFDIEKSREIIHNAEIQGIIKGTKIAPFKVNLGEDVIHGVICFPHKKDWSPTDGRCVLYHNPNAITVPEYFDKEYNLTWTPREILNLEKCPIILYDYRGTGLSQENTSSSFSSRFRPTYASLPEDGLAVLKYAMERFERVEVWGSSLGGGVATVSLDRYLMEYPSKYEDVSLNNHDSFTTTAEVVIPSYPKIANAFGALVGGKLDARTSMKNLIDRHVKITVLCHLDDPVIPKGARMAEYVSEYNRSFQQIIHGQLITSPQYGHANLSEDMLIKLYERNHPMSFIFK